MRKAFNWILALDYKIPGQAIHQYDGERSTSPVRRTSSVISIAVIPESATHLSGIHGYIAYVYMYAVMRDSAAVDSNFYNRHSGLDPESS